jgi:DNA-binding NarL/FixJ family response regulator
MAKSGQIRVLIADDHQMMRKGLCDALQEYPNIEVVGEVSHGDEAVTATLELQPNVVLMDINMAIMDGITATRLIKAQHPEIAVIGLSVYPKDYLVYAMQKAGASDVIGKENVMDELYGAIQRAVASTKRILIFGDSTISAELLPERQTSSSEQIERGLQNQTRLDN